MALCFPSTWFVEVAVGGWLLKEPFIWRCTALNLHTTRNIQSIRVLYCLSLHSSSRSLSISTALRVRSLLFYTQSHTRSLFLAAIVLSMQFFIRSVTRSARRRDFHSVGRQALAGTPMSSREGLPLRCTTYSDTHSVECAPLPPIRTV